jgi:oligosaccharide reducing-end xylanase
MYKLTALCLLYAIIAIPSSVQARTIAPGYQIGTWSGFRTAAVSYTFDDNCSNQLAVAIPIFNQFNFKTTLFTVTNWVTNWTPLKNAASQDHEIASHTVTHSVLSSLNSTSQDNELKNSQSVIETNIANRKCMTLAYPNCIEADRKITAKYYMAARGCSGAVEGATPAQFMNISSIVCGSSGSNTTAQSLNNLANQAVTKGGWCVLLFHGIDNDGGYSPIASSVIRTHLQHLDSLKNVIWVSTFGNVARYIRERDSVSVREVSNTASSITIQVTDNLDNSVFNYPVTIRRAKPAGWSQFSVTQKGQNVAFSIVSQDIMFDVVPDGGDVVLLNGSVANTPGGLQTKPNASFEIHAKLQGNQVMVSVRSPDLKNPNLALFDMRGKKLAVITPETAESGICQFALPKDLFNSGVTVLRLRDGETLMSRNAATDKCFLIK